MNDAFENSIRNKLNEADIPFDQDAWTKMESLLDAGDKNKRPVGWWWLFLLPLLGGMGWWIIQSSTPDKKEERAAISAQKTSVLHRSGQDKVIPESNGITRDNETNKSTEKQEPGVSTSPESKSNNEAIKQSEKHLSGASASPENKLNNETIKQTEKHLSSTSTSPENESNNKTVNKPGNHLPEKNITANGHYNPDISTAGGKQTNIDSAIVVKQNEINFIKIKNVNNLNGYTKILHIAEIPINKDIQQDLNKKIPRRKINSKGLSIGVTLGPDLNVAPSLNYGKVGFNVGVLANYYFNSRWFITTGAVYSKKLYGATNKDYTPPASGSVPYDLVKVNANCDVLDIPVNMNYTFLQVNNNTLSATLGVSNYFMLKEQYQYIYKYYPKWEKTVENQNQHYLAILNVGALYQHPAGRRLIIGVQPYAKIPLHGVGLGQVKLYSAGVSFQLNLVGKKR